MRTYGDVVDDLARSVAHLTATPTPVDHPEHLMVARNAICDGIRHSVDALVGSRVRPTRARISDLQLDPAGAFRSALHQLPRAPGSIALTDVAADRLLPRAWMDSAAASLELTKYDESLGGLHPSARWAPLGDLADIATTLVQVDMELRRALPGIGLPGMQPLIEVRVAAGVTILEARMRGDDRAASRVPEPVPSQPWPIRRAADIPVALERIAAMIHARGSRITMHDFGAVAVNLAQSVHDASGILRISAAHATEPDAWLAMAAHAERTRDALAGLSSHRNQVMTIGPAQPSLIGQTLEVRGGMRTLLIHSESADWEVNPVAGRVSMVLVSQSHGVMRALERAISDAASARQLLVRNRDIRLQGPQWAIARCDDDRLTTLMAALEATARSASPEAGGPAELAPALTAPRIKAAMRPREDTMAIGYASRP